VARCVDFTKHNTASTAVFLLHPIYRMIKKFLCTYALQQTTHLSQHTSLLFCAVIVVLVHFCAVTVVLVNVLYCGSGICTCFVLR
jgi:uncharacterized membrane protein